MRKYIALGVIALLLAIGYSTPVGSQIANTIVRLADSAGTLITSGTEGSIQGLHVLLVDPGTNAVLTYTTEDRDAGVDGASTLRVTEATDSALTTTATSSTTALQIIDDWDETDRAKVNLIVGQAGIAAGIGASGATVPRFVSAQTSFYKSIDLDESEEEVKGTAGELCSLWVTNTATSTRFIKIYNATAASVTVGTTTPDITIGVGGNSSDDVTGSFSVNGGCFGFGTALTIAATTGVADNDTGAPAANDVIVTVGYR
jgi:hypothetical protein